MTYIRRKVTGILSTHATGFGRSAGRKCAVLGTDRGRPRGGADAFRDSDYSCWQGRETAREMANNGDWIEIDDRDYCPNCIEHDETTDEYKPIAGPAEPGRKEEQTK
jgi:hypothetical protein